MTQTGPGQYSGRFRAPASGSYIVNLQYRRTGPEDTSRLANAIVSVPFAPEFRDLSDNAPLLKEISRITGGRVLSLASDPNKANLYEHAGLDVPADASAFAAAADAGVDRDLPAGCGGPACGPRCAGGLRRVEGLG